MSGPSLAPFILKRAWLKIGWFLWRIGTLMQLVIENLVKGLRADDLLPEENDTMQLAIKRLPPKEAYDRIFRLRRAFQCSISHQLLPPSEQTKPEEDIPYISPIIEEIEAEMKERADLESIKVQPRQ